MIIVPVLFIGGVVILNDFFEIASLSFKSIVVTVLICGLSGVLMYFLTRISRRILYGKKLPPAPEADNGNTEEVMEGN